MAIQILLVHSNTDNRSKLVEALQDTSDICIVAEACSAGEALEQIKATPADVVLLGLNLLDMDSLGVSQQIRTTYPRIKLLVQSESFNEDSFNTILQSGAQGCLTPDCTTEELTNAIRRVVQGKPHFCAESQELLIQRCLNRLHS